jgi:hypothetical protein
LEGLLEDRRVDQAEDVLGVRKPVASITASIPPRAATTRAACGRFG